MQNALILNIETGAAREANRTAMLQNSGFQVLETSSGVDALRVARSERPAVAIVPSDLADIRSLDLLRRLKSTPGHSTIQVLSIGPSGADLHAAALDNGADLYLTEPAPANVLIASVRALTRHVTAPARPNGEKSLRRLADAANIGVITGDLNGLIGYCNPSLLSMLGYGAGELLHWTEMTPESSAARNYLEALSQAGVCEPREATLVARDGSPVPVLMGGAVLTRDPDYPAKFAAYVTDLRSIQEIERAFRSSEERRLLALEAAEMGTWFWVFADERINYDDAAYAVLGIDRGAPDTYDFILQRIHPEDRENVNRAVQRAIEELSLYECEFRIQMPNGDIRWIASKGRAHAGSDGKADRMQGVCVDITHRKGTEASLKEVNEALQRSNKDLKEFAYAISHDLQEPLRMVNNFTALLAKRYAAAFDEEGREFLHFIVDGGSRMDRMIRDLLVYSRTLHDRGAFSRVQLEDALSSALSNLEASIEESGAVVTHDPLPEVNGDTVRLSQIFQNLLSNAIKYQRADPPRIHISSSRANDSWTISVRDNGLGMDPKSADRAFGVFRRLHGNKYPGTGVGLAICRHVVERHGGRIWVETEPGVGSTFLFTLPR